MKKNITSFTVILYLLLLCNNGSAQNIFPASGRAGIYITSPAASLQVKGGARIGTTANYVNIDSATGNLSFVGTSAYRVAGNKYAFQYSGNTNYGLFFNSTSSLYEFRNASAVPVFSVNANNGNSVFNGTLKVGAYTFPVADGANGQVLKTNGTGVLTWSNDNGGSGSGWSLTGNAGTNPATNFIGTTDAQPLVFRVNNKRAGFIDSATYNTSFGYNAYISPTSGAYNTANGAFALYSNTGYQNAANGAFALYSNTTGYENTANGGAALYYNTIGNCNTAAGYSALGFNSTGNYNTANGFIALHNNTTGNNNTASGYTALYNNTSGYSNVAVGTAALFSNINRSNLVAVGDSALYNNGIGASASYQAISNTAIGSKALFSNTTGNDNTALGYGTLFFNTTGLSNTATGQQSLYFNSQGNNNTAAGYKALYTNQADNNTAVGVTALYANTTGTGNTATGLEALHFNTQGNNNTANGLDALLSNITGNNNTATGYASLLSNSVGSYNTSNGYNALNTNSTGSYNTALGADALYSANVLYNTAIGYGSLYRNASGNDNTAVGYLALNCITGSQNTAIGSRALQSLFDMGAGLGCTATGYQALTKNTSGNYNTANGYNAMLVNSSGNNNTAIGTNALFSVVSGSDNIALGYGADAESGVNNSIIIGKNVRATSDNIASIGNGATTYLYGPIYVTVSDGRFKKDIKENVPGLDFINSLRPVTYKYKSYELQKFLLQNDATKLSELKKSDFNDAENRVHLGFIAQEVEKIMNDKGYEGDMIKKPANAHDNYGLAYSEFIPPVVKAIQQLSNENDSLKNVNDKQQQQLNNFASLLNNLQQQVNDLKLIQQQCCDHTSIITSVGTNNSTIIITNNASLQQNIPNPFNNTTSIGYTLPSKYMSAQIVITDKNGKTLKAVTISGSGKGSLNVDASTLASGAYQYSLVIDGKLIATKQMIIAR